MKRRRLLYARRDLDDVLKSVLAQIHKTVERPDPGFLTRGQWSQKWKMSPAVTERYLRVAVKSGLLVEREFRVITRGRLRVMSHFGPPDRRRRSAKPT